ncbi:MAG: TrkA C-terminal domain-containing protein, partial [Bacteroidetes bacterium]|nr:TrkA C-terminal domain-containing protein [Bacteroidota bacterium]
NAANLEEITFENLPAEFQNKTIKELDIRNKSGANIVGFRTPDGEYIINPSPDTIIMPKARIFILGTSNQIEAFRDITTQTNLLKG